MLFDQTRRFSVGNKKSKKSHKSLDLWDLTVHYLVSSAERAGIEPKHLTAYKSAFYFPKFQIGNETVTIFAGLFVRLCPLFVCLSHGFKDTTHFLITQISVYKCFSLGARCKLYI